MPCSPRQLRPTNQNISPIEHARVRSTDLPPCWAKAVWLRVHRPLLSKKRALERAVHPARIVGGVKLMPLAARHGETKQGAKQLRRMKCLIPSLS
eukprot:6199468-Pleurochrysis_carterae.AAC.3